MANGNLKSFKIEVGNSYKGALGMVIRVWARTRQEAVEKANRFLGSTGQIEVAETNYQTGIEYCTIYFGANLRLHHVAGGEEIEEVSPELAAIVAESLEE